MVSCKNTPGKAAHLPLCQQEPLYLLKKQHHVLDTLILTGNKPQPIASQNTAHFQDGAANSVLCGNAHNTHKMRPVMLL